MSRRDVQRATDVVEPGGDVVFGQEILDLDGRAEQVAEGGFVFRAVEPADGDAALAPLSCERSVVQAFAQPSEDDPDLLLVGPRFVLRGHLAAFEAVVNLQPDRGLVEGELGVVQTQFRSLNVRAMTGRAMFVNELAQRYLEVIAGF